MNTLEKHLPKIIIGLIVVVSIALLIPRVYERINAGYEGIKVNLYGSEQGVSDVSLVTGAVWFNPITTSIHEYPAYVLTIDYPSFTVNAKDGTEFIVDPTMSLRIKEASAPIIFKKYRKDVEEIINTAILTYVKDAFRIQINSFTTDDIVSYRDSVEQAIERQLRAVLTKESFVLEQVTTGLKYPTIIVDAINAKNMVVQENLRAINELEVAKVQAERVLLVATAEAEANKLKERAITPLLLQQQFIEKWDGKLPQITGGESMMFDISKMIK